MALLGEVLFPPAELRRTKGAMLKWWESRRGIYNVCVGAAGLVTLGVAYAISLVPPHVPRQFAWQPIVAYAVLANVCYTFGWGIEVALQRIMGRRAPNIGPALFRQGLAFSVGLTLLPIIILVISWVARAVTAVLR